MFGEYIHAFYIKQGNSSPIKDLPPTHSEANTPSRGVFAYTQITQTVTHKFEEKKKYIKNNKINK